jgi:GNAT superfamily N-acetyltransferase
VAQIQFSSRIFHTAMCHVVQNGRARYGKHGYAATMMVPISVKHFEWAHWGALWQLVLAHLAENGIVLDPEEIPAIPPQAPEHVDRSGYEWDLEYIEPVYLRGAGGFWLAWAGEMPVGHVGAQDLGKAIELRRMYVRAAYRRQGIGTCLVRTLIAHCAAQGVQAIELWTAREGLGRRLYAKMGFRRTDRPGPAYGRLEAETRYQPGEDEIRMRLGLTT